MSKKLTPYIYILFFTLFSSSIYGQINNVFKLEIKSKDSLENTIIQNSNYKKIFKDLKQLNNIKDKVISNLKEKGYYTLLIDETIQKENKYSYILKLGIKLKEVHIKIDPKDKDIITTLSLKTDDNFLIIKNENLKSTLNSISQYLIENGQLFSKVSLINSNVKNQSLFTELQIKESQKRIINKTIIKGYEDFPSSYVNHYLNSNKNQVLNKNKIEEISERINQLTFVTEIKKPEILFSKDSTLLYIYLKKRQSNSFDGLINFSTENKKLSFRGYLDLNLVNIFNKGEEININWKNNSNNKQDFTLKTKIPYIFNSKISAEASFNLFRNDSTFSNTYSKLSLSYPINKNTNFSILYKSEKSINNIMANNISSFNKTMFGFGVHYSSFKENQFNFGVNFSYGARATDTKTNQYLLNFKIDRLIKASKKIEIYIRNKSGFIFSDSYLENELFREGGTSSIRGFNEQSIFTSKYSYINSEFRLLIKKESYLYSIQDIGVFNTNNRPKSLYSLGLGYQQLKNNRNVNINITIGLSEDNSNKLNHTILSIKTLTLF